MDDHTPAVIDQVTDKFVPSHNILFPAELPIESLYAAHEYPRKNHVPASYAVCPPLMSPFVSRVMAPA